MNIRWIGFKHILLITFFKQSWVHFICTVKWYHVFNSGTHLKVFKYCYVLQTIQLNSHLFTQLNDQTVLFLTIQFNLSHLFAHNLNVKSFYLTSDCLVSYPGPSLWWGVLPLCREAVGIFYSPSRLGILKLSIQCLLV